MSFQGLGQAIQVVAAIEPHWVWILLGAFAIWQGSHVLINWLQTKYVSRSKRSQNGLRQSVQQMRADVKDVKQRVLKVEGTMEGIVLGLNMGQERPTEDEECKQQSQ